MGLCANHAKFLARTVLVHKNDIEQAYKSLDRILRNDQVLERFRRNMHYEKPFLKRNRLSYEQSKRVYDADMQRKIQFVMRKNRVDPWIR